MSLKWAVDTFIFFSASGVCYLSPMNVKRQVYIALLMSVRRKWNSDKLLVLPVLPSPLWSSWVVCLSMNPWAQV